MLRWGKGSISIFLIIITLGSVIFGGLFIDLTRILVADRKVQNALNSAARSALSYYDENLVAQYGLYGVSQAQADAQFKKYFESNLLIAQNDHIKLFKFDVDNPASNTYSKITVQRPLIAEEVFKQQILDYMKYKGPITITMGVIDKFSKAFSSKRSSFIKNNEDAGKSFTRFQNAVNSLQKNTVEYLKKNLGKNLTKKARDIILSAHKKSIDKYYKLMEDTAKMLDDAETAIKNTEEQLAAYESDCNALNAQADQVLDESKAINAEADPSYVDDSTVKRGLDPKLEQAKKEIQIVKENLAVGKAKLEDIKQQLDKLVPEYYRVIDKIDDLEYAISSEFCKEFPNYSRIERLEKQLDLAEAQKQKLEDKINPLVDDLSNINVSDMTNIEIDLSDKTSENDAQRKELEKKQANLQQQLADIFRNIQPYKITAVQKQAAEANLTAQDFNSQDKVESGRDNVFDLFKKIAGVLVTSSRDNIYLTEYIMDKCTYLTSETKRHHYFRVGEVEYIIFGFDKEWENITAAVSLITAIRMVINTVDYLLTSPIPEFWARLAAALIKGALQTVKDMGQMIFTVQGTPTDIGLSPSLQKIRVTYSDHLRLALLMKMDSKLNGLQDTMQATMKTLEKNPSDITTLNTQVCATVRVKVNLIFLPMLGIEKMKFANFEDGQYVIKKTVTLGY